MIELTASADLDDAAYEAIVYDQQPVGVAQAALERVARSRSALLQHLATGVVCYGVTTGLGAQSTVDLDPDEQAALPRHTIIGRASAVGRPLPRAVGRGALVAKLAQFIDGRSGVSPELCSAIVRGLNTGLTPAVPGFGHGTAGEIIALAHVALALIGDGTVLDDAGVRQPTLDWSASVGLQPYEPQVKEGLSLVSGSAVSPSFAWHVSRQAVNLIGLANLVAAASIEGLAAPLSPYSVDAGEANPDGTVGEVMTALRWHLDGSRVSRHDRQAPVSYRVTPQVHAVAIEAVRRLRTTAIADLRSNGDNPLFIADPESTAFGRLVNTGNFHGAALTASVEAATLAIIHVGALAEKRLYRLLDERSSGLSRQLAKRPGLDAGLITVHKACLDHVAALRMLASPISVALPDSSFGQEDAQAFAIPAIHRLRDAIELAGVVLAHEAYVAAVAIDQRAEPVSRDVSALHARLRERIPAADGDRSYGPDLDLMIEILRIPGD